MDKLQGQRDKWRKPVFAACGALAAQGIKPTRKTVMERIGGNPHVVGGLLREWSDTRDAVRTFGASAPTNRLFGEIDVEVARQFQAAALQVIARIGQNSLRLRDVSEAHDVYIAQHRQDIVAFEDQSDKALRATEELAARGDRVCEAMDRIRDRRDDIAAEMQTLNAGTSVAQAEIARLKACLAEGRASSTKLALARDRQVKAAAARLERLEQDQSFARHTVEQLAIELARQ